MNTGGPAFPSSNDVVIGNVGTSGHTGMTLRDYFAAKAMQENIRLSNQDVTQIIAERAYAQADAMLAAREAK